MFSVFGFSPPPPPSLSPAFGEGTSGGHIRVGGGGAASQIGNTDVKFVHLSVSHNAPRSPPPIPSVTAIKLHYLLNTLLREPVWPSGKVVGW